MAETLKFRTMITKDNVKELFETLDNDSINVAMSDSKTDYVAVWIGGYGDVYIEPFYVGIDDDEDILSTGGIICDKDDILRLYKESGANNKTMDYYL